MKHLFLVLAAVATMGLSSPAKADIQHPLYQCALSFNAKGGGFQVLVGYFKLKGTGALRCVDIAGNTEVIPVRVAMGGGLLAARVAVVPFMEIHGIATGIGISSSPKALMGRYELIGASAEMVLGAATDVSVHGARNAIEFNLGLALTAGVGAEAGLSALEIRPL